MLTSKPDILGSALLDYQGGKYTEDIKTHSSLWEEDVLSLPHLFRTMETMPELERTALRQCDGEILDIGCGAGGHSLWLQSEGLSVLALDNSPGAIATCALRGVHNRICTDITVFHGSRFDTILLMMNGIGIAGSLGQLGSFLAFLGSLLNPGGQILMDSCDIIYMFYDHMDGGYLLPGDQSYYGEVTFRMEYKGELGTPFNWLYIDFPRLYTVAGQNNLHCQLVQEGSYYDYLAKLSLLK